LTYWTGFLFVVFLTFFEIVCRIRDILNSVFEGTLLNFRMLKKVIPILSLDLALIPSNAGWYLSQ